MPLSLRARVVFPVDQPPIENGVVTIDGGRILTVGTKSPDGDVIDLGCTALIPGLVNAHTHLEFSYLHQPLGNAGIPFVDWIRLIIAERGRSTYTPQQAAEAGLQESVACGVSTLGDITTGTMLPGADITHFHEVIGFSRARADSALNALHERMNTGPMAAPIARGVSPHAPYTVSPKLVELLTEFAAQNNLPIAMHLAESREELELLRDGAGPFRVLLEERSMWDPDAIPLGSRPLNYLRILAKAPRALVIHGNYLDSAELGFLGAMRNQMSLVYCPRTHSFFGHEPYPLAAALAAGARVALGTDSRASNPDLSLLTEMRFVSRQYDWLDPATVLRMGTLSGAVALGRDADVGSLTSGKFANLVAVPIADESLTTPDEMLNSVLASDAAPSAVYLAGRPLHA